jgi:hypothetical protein
MTGIEACRDRERECFDLSCQDLMVEDDWAFLRVPGRFFAPNPMLSVRALNLLEGDGWRSFLRFSLGMFMSGSSKTWLSYMPTLTVGSLGS